LMCIYLTSAWSRGANFTSIISREESRRMEEDKLRVSDGFGRGVFIHLGKL
jgi:hypothetical protein